MWGWNQKLVIGILAGIVEVLALIAQRLKDK